MWIIKTCLIKKENVSFDGQMSLYFGNNKAVPDNPERNMLITSGKMLILVTS